MRKTDKEIEESIARAIESFPGKDPEKIWDITVEKSKGTEWYLENTERSSGRSVFWRRTQLLALAAAVLVAFIGLQVFRAGFRPAATIYLDVNPSVTLEINKKERVMAVRPGNDDGEKILSEMDLVGTDADVAVNALIGACIRYGYLDEAHAILLISVECGDKEEEKALKERLSVKVTKNLTDSLGGGTVLEQEVEADDELRKMGREYRISLGKATLIRKIAADHPELSVDSLAQMSLSELVRELYKQGIDLRDYLDHEGDDYFDDLYEDSVQDEDFPNLSEVEEDDSTTVSSGSVMSEDDDDPEDDLDDDPEDDLDDDPDDDLDDQEDDDDRDDLEEDEDD